MAAKVKINANVEKIYNNFKMKAEKCVVDIFPKRIISLYETLNQPEFSLVRSENFTLSLYGKDKTEYKTNHVENNTHSESTHSECKHSESKHSESKHSESTHSESTHSESTHSESTHSESTHSESTHSESTHSESTHLDVNSTKSTAVKFIPSNKNVMDTINLFNPIAKQFMEDVHLLNVWLSLLHPECQFSSNGGSMFLIELFHMLVHMKYSTVNYIRKASSYYIYRCDIIAKISKYPHVEDYRTAVDEADEQILAEMSTNLHKIHNNYIKLYNYFIKNMEKIKQPARLAVNISC